jgi:hypothetical protein
MRTKMYNCGNGQLIISEAGTSEKAICSKMSEDTLVYKI